MTEVVMQEYPKLMWVKDGREVTVHSKAEEAKAHADGARTVPPGVEEPKPAPAHATTHVAVEAPAEAADDSESDGTAHGKGKRK